MVCKGVGSGHLNTMNRSSLFDDLWSHRSSLFDDLWSHRSSLFDDLWSQQRYMPRNAHLTRILKTITFASKICVRTDNVRKQTLPQIPQSYSGRSRSDPLYRLPEILLRYSHFRAFHFATGLLLRNDKGRSRMPGTWPAAYMAKTSGL
jgi:hypothetical protein